MFDKILRFLFSMKMMVVGMLAFAVSIGAATFIESDYGTPASKIAVYNTVWFQLLLVYLSIILIVNIVNYKMYQKGKRATFLFHLSFLIIIIGAGLTRYIGYEGQMRIKQGDASNTLYSTTPYLTVKMNDGKMQIPWSQKHWLDENVQNPFHFSLQLPGSPKVKVDYVSYQENMVDTLLPSQSKEARDAIVLVIAGRKKTIFRGQRGFIGNHIFSYEAGQGQLPEIEIKEENNQLMIQSPKPFTIVNMTALSVEDRQTGHVDSSAITEVPADTLVPFNLMHMYKFGRMPIVFKAYLQDVVKTLVKAKEKDAGDSYLTMKFSTPNASKEITINGNTNGINNPSFFAFSNLNFEVSYGAKPIKIPFYVRCDTFELDRYPGSDMASSYASVLTILDSANNEHFTHRIFMNHVLDYNGFRFFQSSYFPDESGTILSVNADWWGTMVTYVGYFLMGLGMVLSLFNPKGRMKELTRIIKKSRENRMKLLKSIAIIIGVGLMGTATLHAQDTPTKAVKNTETVGVVNSDSLQKDTVALSGAEHNHSHDHDHAHAHDSLPLDSAQIAELARRMQKVPEVHYLPKEYAKQLNDLLVQDYDGRIIPFNTLAMKLLRKIHRSDEFNGKTAVQTILAMHLYPPRSWRNIPLIYVAQATREPLGLGRYASINELEDSTGHFKWMNKYRAAHEKSDAHKNEFDKKLIKLGERYRVVKAVEGYRYMRILPIPGDDNGGWTWPFSEKLQGKENTREVLALNLLRQLSMVSAGKSSFVTAKPLLDSLKAYQWQAIDQYVKEHPEAHKLSHTHVKVEIAYNKMGIFNKILYSYLILGVLLLIVFFIRTLKNPTIKSEAIFRKISYVPIALVFITFLFHATGLGMRWYITEHAPWSDGYEAVVFIAWMTMLIGFFFIKKNPAIIAATTLLAALMIFVTKLNLLDPSITPLEPVLKSYWLMIHVAVITSSYGFLGICAILGVVNMVLYLCKNKDNKKRLQMNINEITSISEIVMIVGLFALTIGMFLGGVWANESWGRYWGWDPKEVWALVSVLTYAVIIHVRWVPRLNNKLLFNILSLWGYGVIMFTFFGVNYILVGLHSYARTSGAVTLPTSLIITIAVLGAFTLATIGKYRLDKKRLK